MNNKLFCWLLFIILCIIWGSSFKLMKDSSAGLTGAQIAALRIFSAALIFVPFAIFHFKKIPRNKIIIVILSAVCGNLLPAFCFAIAMTKMDGSLGGILNSLTPLCVIIIGIGFFKDKIKLRKIIGVLTGFVGLLILTLVPALTGEKNISFNNIGYTLLILLATFLYGINVNMVSHYLKGVKALHVATVSLAAMIIPTLIILVQQNFFHLDFNNAEIKNSVISSIVLGIGGSAVATAIFYTLVVRAGGIFASLVTYGVPFVAIGWGFIDGEKITFLEIICMAIILLGVYLANRSDKKQTPLSNKMR